MFGVMAYPAQGIYKSVKSLQRSNVEQIVTSGRTSMMAEDSRVPNGIDPAQVISRFNDISA